MSPVCAIQSTANVDLYSDMAVGPESIVIRGVQRDALVQYHAPVSQMTAARIFSELASTWKMETTFTSSMDEIVLHPAYQQIIGLGPVAIPLIADELRSEPNYWFAALRALTGANPVPEEPCGDVAAMTYDWLRWLSARGYSS